MPAKAPIYLKVSSNKKGKKCRLRDILSPDMISPPLGDFRHTIHIGKGGQRDAFGDMSFLQGKYELLPGKGGGPPHYGLQSELLRANSTGDASVAETPSPVLKNAISLPAIGSYQALTLPLMSPATSDPPNPRTAESREEVDVLRMEALLHSQVLDSQPSSPLADKPSKPDVLLDLLESKDASSRAAAAANKRSSFDNGSLDSSGSLDGSKEDLHEKSSEDGLGHFAGHLDTCFQQELSKLAGEWVDRDSGRICHFEPENSLVHITGSMLSLELDLGPSILDEVLNIMDKPAVKSRP